MKKLTIALLSGGMSPERDVSLNGGDQVIDALDKDKYTVIRYDPKTDLGRLVEDAHKIDMALIILHGLYGEDGTLQGMLDLLNIPYQGSGVLGSALAMNKLASKKVYEQAGIPTPPYTALRKNDPESLQKCMNILDFPIIVKPVNGGSSIGMSVADSETSLKKAFDAAFDIDNEILAETFIEGLELTGSVIGNNTLEALPVVEIIPDKGYAFFDYEAKYTKGATVEICPARIDVRIEKSVKTISKAAHRALFCRGYSRTDFILKDDDLFVLETNTIPGMTQTSLLPLAAEKAGISFSKLLDKLIALSIEG